MATLSAKQHAKYATIHVKGANGKKQGKFPENDKSHAVQAIRFENRAKPALTSDQKHTIEARAAKFGVGPLAKKNQQAKKPQKKG